MDRFWQGLCTFGTVFTLLLCSMYNLTFIHCPSSSGLSREITLNDAVHSNFQVHDLFLFLAGFMLNQGSGSGVGSHN
jgi:hypothetical protein